MTSKKKMGQLVDNALFDHPQFLLVGGDNGVGKKAYLEYLQDDWRDAGWPAPIFGPSEHDNVLPMIDSSSGPLMVLLDHVTDTLHHTRQKGFWEGLVRAATASHATVVGITQSWDAIKGFTGATEQVADHTRFIRLELRSGEVAVVEYDHSELTIATEQSIETR